ncbi:MAG: sigma-70 family RNA polymerase sigma factor [Desulfobacteraceae bacterium]|nr:sigma-70 family RNA polymerase sigma factor [Desulfobacteraceae bacterium]
MTDQELIARIIAGDPISANIFVDRFSRLIWFILLRSMEIPLNDSQEIYQNFFMRLWEKDYKRLRSWRGDGELRAYLRRILRNCAADYFRGLDHPAVFIEGEEEAADPNDPFALPIPAPEEEMLAQERRDKVYEALQQLSPRDQELINRYHFHDESYAEIAEHMDMSRDNVGVSMHRARERLRNKLEERWPDFFA